MFAYSLAVRPNKKICPDRSQTSVYPAVPGTGTRARGGTSGRRSPTTACVTRSTSRATQTTPSPRALYRMRVSRAAGVALKADHHGQCRITNVGGLVQNFSGGLFSRRMGAPVSQTNAAGGSVQYRWGSGGRCKRTSGVRKRTHFGNNVYKICFK